MDSLQRNGSVPLYEQVSDILKRRILNEEYPTGTNLPAEPDLCEEFGVARGTIRQALATLQQEGFVHRQQGRGTTVIYGSEQARAPKFSGNLIGFVVPYVRDSFVTTILLGVERAASEHNLSVTFKHVQNDLTLQRNVLQDLVDQQLAGILLYPVNSEPDDAIQQLLADTYPVVLVDRYLRGVRADYVMSDHFGGALQATQHLIELGHERIGLVSWRDPSISLEHRAAGYRQALMEMGYGYDPDLTCEVESYPQIKIEPLRVFLQANRDMTAIFAVNDQIALAVYQAARETGLRIPEDIALVGFDNLDLTQYLDVPLTTVEQPAFEIGRRAVEVLIQRINGEVQTPQHIILPTQLIIRASCGAHLFERPKSDHEGL